MKKDIVWLDYARTTGMFLVIFGHTLQSFKGFNDCSMVKDLWNFIYLFHMPLFFVISGLLFTPPQTQHVDNERFTKELLYKIVFPYLVYQSLFLPISIFQNRAELIADGHWYKLISGILMGDGYRTPYSMVACVPCWFIVCVIQLRILFHYFPMNKLGLTLLITLSCVFLWARKHFSFDLYFCLDSTIMAIPYFIFGHYIRRYAQAIEQRRSVHTFFAAITLFIVVALILHLNGPAQMNGPSYGRYLLLNYIAGISGSLAIFYLSQVMSRLSANAFIKTISRNTLFIIFYHWVILFFLRALLSRIPNFSDVAIIIFSLFLSFIILSASYITIQMYINKIPILFGKLKA